jgi:hypothetical protein
VVLEADLGFMGGALEPKADQVEAPRAMMGLAESDLQLPISLAAAMPSRLPAIAEAFHEVEPARDAANAAEVDIRAESSLQDPLSPSHTEPRLCESREVQPRAETCVAAPDPPAEALPQADDARATGGSLEPGAEELAAPKAIAGPAAGAGAGRGEFEFFGGLDGSNAEDATGSGVSRESASGGVAEPSQCEESFECFKPVMQTNKPKGFWAHD